MQVSSLSMPATCSKEAIEKKAPFFDGSLVGSSCDSWIVHHCPSTASQKNTGMYTACLFLSSELFLLALSLLVCGMS